MPERPCHTACVKGNNYLLDFLRGLVQFRIITGSLEVINTGAHIHLICQLPIQRNITGDGVYQRKCFSLSVQGHLHSRCWLGCIIILKTFINVLGQKSRVSIWHFCRRRDETGELIAAHSCRWLNSARGEDREEHRDTWNITARSCCVRFFIFIYLYVHLLFFFPSTSHHSSSAKQTSQKLFARHLPGACRSSSPVFLFPVLTSVLGVKCLAPLIPTPSKHAVHADIFIYFSCISPNKNKNILILR